MDHKKEYEKQGYCHVKEAVPPEIVDLLLLLIERSLGSKPLESGHTMDAQAINLKKTLEVYTDKFFPLMTFQWGLTGLMSRITGKTMLPSFGTFRIYQKGDLCKVHSDRMSCEHSLNITLGYSDDIVWGLEMGKDKVDIKDKPNFDVADDFGAEKYATIEMQPGDAVAYHGVHYRHGRLTPNPNRWSAHFFMNFVEKDGPFAKYAFDGRQPKRKAEFVF